MAIGFRLCRFTGMATYKLLRDYFTHLFVHPQLWDRSAASVHALGAQALYVRQACLSGGTRVFASARRVSSGVQGD